MYYLVDSNVILDIVLQDPVWYSWSSNALETCADNGTLCINPIIYAEISIGFQKIEDLEQALPSSLFNRIPLPYEAAFLAGKCFLAYRKRKGEKRAPLPDFYIGAHAAVQKMALVTRDAKRYRTYFPHLQIITPPNTKHK